MKKIKLLIGVLLSAILVAGCNMEPDTIIKVNNQSITKSQYNEIFDNVVKNTSLAQYGIDLRKDPDNYIHLVLKERVVNELIIRKLLEQEIKKRHIKVSQADIEKQYAVLIDKIGSKEKFNEILKQSGISQAKFKKDLEDEVKRQKLVDSLAVVNVSDKDVEKYYKKNIDSFKYPDKVKASYIWISSDKTQVRDLLLAKKENQKLAKEELDKKIKEELTAKEKKAQDIYNQAKKDPTKFAQLAKDNSDDALTAAEGGNMGFVSRDDIPKELADVIFKQKPNTISDMIKTPYGYAIIMVTDRMKAGVEPLEKVKFELKNYLEQQEKTQVLQKFVEDIKSKAKIEYIDESYNPDVIMKKIKEAQTKNPSLLDAQSAAE